MLKEEEKEENEIKEELQIRIKLKLSSHIVQSRKSYELPENTEIAVPSSIRRKGLSLLVNHLLHDVATDNDEEEDEEDEKENEEESKEKEPSISKIPFDFLFNQKLLRSSLELAARRDGYFFEDCLIIEYFPSIKLPEESWRSDALPDWISDMRYNSTGKALICSCYDGSVKVFLDDDNSNSDASQSTFTNTCHTSPIKCLDSINNMQGDIIIATGGMDFALKSQIFTKNHEFDSTTVVEYVNGHSNSISSVALKALSETTHEKFIMASGDWDGGLSLWNVITHAPDVINSMPTEKKTKINEKESTSISQKQAREQYEPIISLKGHTSNISGIKHSNTDVNHLITSSHDYSLKVWDIQKQDCILTFNGSRVITAMDVGINTDVVITTHPDCTVRLWDVRVMQQKNPDTKKQESLTKNTLFQPSHSYFVSDVKWSRNNPFLFATTSYDGTCKLWDIRSTLPLHTFKAFHNNGGKDIIMQEKGLCIEFGMAHEGDSANDASNGKNDLFCAGTDCIVKKFQF